MSGPTETCSLCSGGAIRRSLLSAECCESKGVPGQYAALETYLQPLSAPSVIPGCFMSSATDETICHRGDSVACTIAVLCQSVKNLGYVAHVVKDGEADVPELLRATEASRGTSEYIVLSVSSTPVPEPTCTLYSSLVPAGQVITEDQAMKTMLSLKSASMGLVWYWSADLLGYSYILNSDSTSMWALTVEPSEQESRIRAVSVTLPSSLQSSLRVMPFFYCSAGKPSVVVMGTGSVGGLREGDLAVELSALSAAPINRLYSSVTSTGRCFCCEYMTRLHSKVHLGSSRVAEATQKLQLSKQFWQVTKRR